MGAICHGTLKKSHKILYVPSPDLNPGLLGDRRTLYHVAIKAGLYRKPVQVYDIPNYHIPCDIHTKYEAGTLNGFGKNKYQKKNLTQNFNIDIILDIDLWGRSIPKTLTFV